MPKIDLKKELKAFYTAPKKPELVDVPLMNYLLVDGQGDPNGEDFKHAMEALYSVSYTLKFMAKKAGNDYTVMPPEGLFWAEDMRSFAIGDKNAWKWTLIVAQIYNRRDVFGGAGGDPKEEGPGCRAQI